MRSRPVSPDVYFPIEITSREYAGHVLLATRLSSAGINSVIGHREPVRDIIRSARRPGVIYFKGSGLTTFGRPDFCFVGQDPESGLVYRDYADFFEARRDTLRQLESSHAYFCFGQFDYAYLRNKYPKFKNQIYRTGSPRTMLWGADGNSFYKSRVEKIKNKYGDFILLVSSGMSGNRYLVRPDKLLPRERNARKAVSKYLRDSECKRDRLLDLAIRLGKKTGLKVVIRPHPAEDWNFWKKATSNCSDVFVDSAIDLNAWLRAASFAVQRAGSTTAFEAWCSNTPVVSDSASDEWVNESGEKRKWITHEITVHFPSTEELLADFFSVPERWNMLRKKDAAQNIVASRLDSPSDDATVAISEVIGELVSLNAPTGITSPNRGLVWRRDVQSLIRMRRDEEILGRTSPPPFKRWPLSRETVQADAAQAGVLLSVPTPHVVQILPNAFLIEAQNV